MKNKYILSLLALVFLLQSCDRTESTVFNVDSDDTLVKFGSTTATLPVEAGNTTASLDVFVTTRSSSDRSIEVTIDPTSTADPSSYTISGVIPANEFVGKLDVTGIFDNLPATGVTQLIVSLASINGQEVSIENSTATVNMFRFCNFTNGATFLGDYQLTVTQLGIFGTPTFFDAVVTVEQGATIADRKFSTLYYPAFGGFGPIDFPFSLICGDVIVGTVDSGVSCDPGNVPNVSWGPAPNPSSFDVSDDSQITVNFLDDVGGASCGTEVAAQFVLTKL